MSESDMIVSKEGSEAIQLANAQEARIEQLREALVPFVGFKHFVDAMRECQEEKPLTKHSCIASVMGCGGSDYIWYGDLERAEQALKD